MAAIKQFIVKVQMSIITSEKAKQVLIYNENRTLFTQMDATPSLEDLMDGELKLFFYAYIDKKKKLVIDRPAPWQDW